MEDGKRKKTNSRGATSLLRRLADTTRQAEITEKLYGIAR